MSFFSKSSYNQAVDRFKNLPNLHVQADAWIRELVEIIVLCISELKQNPQNWENFILLANLFRMAADDIEDESPDLHEYFITLASLVITFWDANTLHIKTKDKGMLVLHRILDMASGTKYPDLAEVGGSINPISTVFTHLFDEQNHNIWRNSLLQPGQFGSRKLVLPRILHLATGLPAQDFIKAALLRKYKDEIPGYFPSYEETRAVAVIQRLEKFGITPQEYLNLLNPLH